ncbi:MAG: CHASE2 domain-containing protein [Verrucomicrobia bacterium]|nr:CHASE2 domain-containing protein [Verrucomicrobiota bacterium]
MTAAVTVLIGWLFLLPFHTPNPLVRWSYDLLQLALPHHDYTDVAIIYLDEQAMQDYQIKPGQTWPRSIHARLLDRLTRDQARVVVFDVTMTQPGEAADDAAFAQALHANGRVVLAGDKVPLPGISLGYTIVPPLELFETNAAGWGTAKLLIDPDQVCRRNLAGDPQEPGLAWAAATVAGANVTRNESLRLAEERWLNYYSSARPFEGSSMTYTNAEASPAGFFRDKAVFIGGKPETLARGEITDVFGTPFTKWNNRFIPGVELTALAYANLMHTQWLSRTGLIGELILLLATGVIAGFGLFVVRPRWVPGLALLLVGLAASGSVIGMLSSRTWFPWAIVSFAQLPCALACHAFARREPFASPSAEPMTVRDGRPEIPDHAMIRCIGEGAYGQVWLARNAIGLYHAVKVIYRSRFGIEEPYDRALRGIQKFMPISRSYEGFVHILHMGRNDRLGFFFYIMEAGDDQKMGQQIDPALYAPRTLGSELRASRTLAPRACIELLLAVTEAVDRLHQHQLIHRDIKPDNILFVNGQPKLADIDLVTTLSAPGNASLIGTEGYMAPEGPGSAAADVFSLGRVLYVALTGKAPVQCPELPTNVTAHPDSGLFFELNQIICKACDFDLQRRYSSAASMHADLQKVSRRFAK